MKSQRSPFFSMLIPALFLALALVFLPSPAWAADSWTQADLTYTLQGDEAVVTRYTGTAQDIVVPGITVIDGQCYYTVIDSVGYAQSFFTGSPRTVTFQSGVRFRCLRGLFYNQTELRSVSFAAGVSSASVQDMGSLFNGCAKLSSVDLTGLDTSGALYMSYMFSRCAALTGLDLSGFNTGSVTNFCGMFFNASGLRSLDLSGFRTASATNMSSMFEGCAALSSLNVSGFDTRNVTMMLSMFKGCASLQTLDLSSFRGDSLASFVYAFNGCGELYSLNLSGLSLGSEVNAYGCFGGLASLSSLVLPRSVAASQSIELPYPDWLRAGGGSYNADTLPTGSAGGRLYREVRVASVTADKAVAAKGGAVTWTVSANGGVKPYTYYYQLYKGSTIIASRSWSGETAYSYDFADIGTYHLVAYVRDAGGVQHSLRSGDISVSALSDITVGSSAERAAVGSAVTWTVSAAGGTLPYQYYYLLHDGTSWIDTKDWSASASYSHSFTAAGTYRLFVYVKDAIGDQLVGSSGYLTVTAPPSVTAVAPSVSRAAVGGSASWTVAASGGQGPYQYYYRLYDGSTLIATQKWTASASYSYRFTQAGSYRVRAYVRDADGLKASKMSSYVTVTPPPPSVTAVEANLSAAGVGDTVTWFVAANGGSGGYQYYYKLYNGSALVDSQSWSAAADYSYSMREAGAYRVKVYVRDAAGQKGSKVSTYVKVTAPLALSAVSAADAAAPGDTVTWTVSATGGQGGYSYYYKLYNGSDLVATQKWTAAASYSYRCTQAGSYRVRAYVRDAAGTTVSKLSAYTKVADQPLVISAVTPSLTAAAAGSSVTFTVTAAGGQGPYRYYYKLYNGSTLIASQKWSGNTLCTALLDTPGRYRMLAYVKDAAGTQVSLLSAWVTVS